jgi:hypothetical protein
MVIASTINKAVDPSLMTERSSSGRAVAPLVSPTRPRHPKQTDAGINEMTDAKAGRAQGWRGRRDAGSPGRRPADTGDKSRHFGAGV